MEELPFFVYGTLRNNQKNYDLLRGKTIAEVPALLERTVLYALQSYPMVMPGDGVVHGELMTVNSEGYTQLVQQLDEFEGSTPEENYLFRRIKQTVQLASGERVSAWVYVGNPQYLSSVPHTPILHGDWCRYVQERVHAQS